MRRGVFGGSFDPVHLGHITVVEAAAKALDLDVVNVIPAFRQPFKPLPLAPPKDRLAMLQLAVGNSPRLVVDARELERGGTSYTIDTLEDLRATFPDDALTLLIGADSADALPTWRSARRLRELASIAVLTRPGAKAPSNDLVDCVVPVPAVDVSATDLRNRVGRGEAITGLVTTSVEAYIGDHGLYRLAKD